MSISDFFFPCRFLIVTKCLVIRGDRIVFVARLIFDDLRSGGGRRQECHFSTNTEKSGRAKTSRSCHFISVLTFRVLKALLLLAGLGDHFDFLGVEDADVGAVSVEHLQVEHEVLALVRVGDEQGLGSAVVL